MTDFAISNAPWLTLAAVLIGAAVLGGGAYWKVRSRGRSVAQQAQKAQGSDDSTDKTRRMLLGGSRAATVTEWKAAVEAVETYSDPELRRARDKWSLRFRTACEKEAEAERHIKEIKDPFPDGVVPKDSDSWLELQQAERQQRLNATVAMNTGEEARQLSIDIAADVYKKLCLGTLLAKGLCEPHVAGNAEVHIPTAEWRALMLHHLDAKAVERGIDGKLVYSGIVIGKP